jgi:RNase H-fold protein (predicted Holliday junction resolvase)
MNSEQSSREVIVAVDPGREKCGVAVVTGDLELILKEIVSREEAVHRVLELAEKHGAGKVVLGDRTGSREFAGEIAKARKACSTSVDKKEHAYPEIVFIDEHMSSMEGRRRYLLDHPLPGLGKLIPVSLRTPSEPFDDYVAVVLAERFFQCLKR